jgi:pentatricopeptide repeat protein
MNILEKSHIFIECKSVQKFGNNAILAWTAIIKAHNIHGQTQEALQLFHEMQEAGVLPDEYTYSCILSVIADLASLHEGQHIHTQLMVRGIYCVQLFTFDRRNMETLFTFQ